MNTSDEKSRLEKLASWKCSACGLEMRGRNDDDGMCLGCVSASKVERRRTCPRPEVFEQSRVPQKHRGPAPWVSADWPRDPRGGVAGAIHPADDWPALAARLVADRSEVGPRSIVLSGKNDLGKSHRAADLVVRLHRAGIMGSYWVHEGELVAEAKDWTRQHWTRAIAAPVLVVDDLCSCRGGPAKTEEAAGMALDLVEARWGALHKITIYTTHRPMSEGAESIRRIVPAVYGRLLDGLLLNLTGSGHRGGWAKEAKR